MSSKQTLGVSSWLRPVTDEVGTFHRSIVQMCNVHRGEVILAQTYPQSLYKLQNRRKKNAAKPKPDSAALLTLMLVIRTYSVSFLSEEPTSATHQAPCSFRSVNETNTVCFAPSRSLKTCSAFSTASSSFL